MKEIDMMDGIENLLDKGSFSGPDPLLSLCLAMGLASEIKDDAPFDEMPEGFTDWEIWPMVQLVAHDMDKGIEDMGQMRSFLLPYLNGGYQLIVKKLGSARGGKALSRIASMING